MKAIIDKLTKKQEQQVIDMLRLRKEIDPNAPDAVVVEDIPAPERVHLSRGKSKGAWDYNGCWGVFPFPADMGNVGYVRDDLYARLDAENCALRDAWRGDIRAHQDQCPATFSNCVPDDCGCGLTELRNTEMDALKTRE